MFCDATSFPVCADLLQEALTLFSKAQDLAEAQYHVARCYDHGIGTIEDKTKAVHWYTKVCFGHRQINGTHVQLALHYMPLFTHAVMSQKRGMYSSCCQGIICYHPCVGSRLHCATAARVCCCLHAVICMECAPCPALRLACMMQSKLTLATVGCTSYTSSCYSWLGRSVHGSYTCVTASRSFLPKPTCFFVLGMFCTASLLQ